jgi:hypothetical protein
MFNKIIPFEVTKEQEGQLKEILLMNAIRFFQAGGTLTLDVWVGLTTESQDAFIEARELILKAMLETEAEPENEHVADPQKPEVPVKE